MRVTLIILVALIVLPATAAEIIVTGDGEPLASAVVLVERTDGVFEIVSDLVESGEVNIDQIGREFVPTLRIVRPGTMVAFPNRDETHHHVYSFSAAKPFELPLYRGEATAPVMFDQVGIVTLGCNIHDWMQAHVVVTDAPLVALTGDTGRAVLDLPDGRYQISVWHPRLRGERFVVGALDIVSGQAELRFELELAPDVQRRRPRRRDRDY